MRQRLIVTDAYRHFSWKPLSELLERALISGRATPKHNKLHLGIQHFFQRTERDINSFLFGQTSDNPEQWNLWGNRELKLSLECRLTDSFSAKLVRRVTLCEKLVVCGFPFLVINSIENAS